jgi:hypothetical protein
VDSKPVDIVLHRNENGMWDWSIWDPCEDSPDVIVAKGDRCCDMRTAFEMANARLYNIEEA